MASVCVQLYYSICVLDISLRLLVVVGASYTCALRMLTDQYWRGAEGGSAYGTMGFGAMGFGTSTMARVG